MVKVINAVILWLMQAKGQESLMLTPNEQHAIEQLRNQIPPLKKKSTQKTLRLDGIAYYDEHLWTVWLNGRAYGAGESFEYGQIVRVEKDHISVYIESLQKEIVLMFNQEISLNP